MNPNSKRNLRRVIVAGVLVCLVICCGGFGYVAHRGLHTYVETYKTTTPPSLHGVIVDIDVRPQERINDGFGDRLVGPPYELMISLRDPSGQMTRARLHSVRVVGNGGDEFSVPVTNGDNPTREQGFVTLYARVEGESLGVRPQIIADIELVMSDASVREAITFSLRRGTRASFNIP